MKLNTLEKCIVNSAPRAWAQKFIEIPKLLKHAPLPEKACILEVGCGRGKGLKALQQRLNPTKLHAFDLDPAQISRANDLCPEANIWQGALPKISAEAQTYDGVFCFGVLHHVDEWQKALEAIRDVTKPDGYIYLIEYYKALICNPIIKRLLDHPQENRFSHSELIAQCEKQGLSVLHDSQTLNCAGMVILKKVA